jgi:hypothetical protein
VTDRYYFASTRLRLYMRHHLVSFCKHAGLYITRVPIIYINITVCDTETLCITAFGITVKRTTVLTKSHIFRLSFTSRQYFQQVPPPYVTPAFFHSASTSCSGSSASGAQDVSQVNAYVVVRRVHSPFRAG